MAYTKNYNNMDAKQRLILQNEAELDRMRAQLGIKPKMYIVHNSGKPTKSSFNLRDLNKELINNKQ